ncbi:MAG: hypothetical protein WBX15_06225 [Thermoanaerobaculia bacterium]
MNETLRVPTVEVTVQISYAAGRDLSGSIFLPALAHWHDGPTRPDEWINDGHLFFPFLPDGAERALILNKRQIIVVTFSTTATAGLELPQQVGLLRPVRVDCGTAVVEGMVSIDMPPGQSRTLDFVNRTDQPFLPVWSGDRFHLVQKKRIIEISDPKED